MKKKTTILFGSIIASTIVTSVIGFEMVDSLQINNTKNYYCLDVNQSKQISTFHKIPAYIPIGYSLECIAITEPNQVSMILTTSGQISERWSSMPYTENGTIKIDQTDEKTLLGERFSENLWGKQLILEEITGIKNHNPKLNPVYLEINGQPAFGTEGCKDCGISTASFADGTAIQQTFEMPNRIKIIDDSGYKTTVEGFIPLDQLVKIAESMQ